MSQSVLSCYKLVFLQQCYRVYLLLCTASISIFWLLAVCNASLAQVNPNNKQANDFQLGLGELLPVPQSPLFNKQQTMLPPPKTSDPDTPPTTTGISNVVQQTSVDELKQLESSFIQQQTTGRVSQAIPSKFAPTTQRQTKLPQLAAGGGVSDLGLGLMSVTNNSGSSLLQQNTEQLNAQAIPPTTTVTQEFTAPTASLNSQSQVAPLPPLPNTTATARQDFTVPAPPSVSSTIAPTFNQLLNSQGTTPPSAPSTPGQTFNLLLTCQVATPPSAPSTPGQTFNQLLTCQVATPSSVPSTTPLTFNQLSNSQPVIPSSVPSTAIDTRQQLSIAPTAPVPRDAIPPVTPPPAIQRRNNTALREPFLHFQGVYVDQGSTSSARARLLGVYPLTPQALFGATLDLTSQESTFVDSRGQGLNINELYFATSLAGLPNLRFVVGQLDLTSYFDRNSFAKDGASQFFNPVFQTNPALAATGIASRTGLLVNWSANDNIEAKAAVFSSADKLSSFTLDGFAGEIGIRYGNAIIRGTYATDRDAGVRDTFPEAFSIPRNSERTAFGPLKDDREEAYGLNAEVFIPNLKLGLFGRYGRYEDRDLGKGADTYSFGASLLDLFTSDDRLGLAYGRALSNESLHRGDPADVLELYYDFPFLPNLRLGFTVQGRNSFDETVVGVRVRSEFDITPRGRSTR